MNTIFICKRCNTEFGAKHHLIAHLTRKFVCEPIDSNHNIDTSILIHELKNKPTSSFVCDVCLKSFSSKQNLQRHNTSNICKYKKSNDIDSINKVVSNTSSEDNNLTIIDINKSNSLDSKNIQYSKQTNEIIDTNLYIQKYNMLETQMKELQEQMKHMNDIIKNNIQPIQHQTQVICNNNININNNVIQIQIQNFGEEKIEHITSQFLDKCLLECNSGVRNLIREIHFNPNLPENHNIRSLSKKQNTLEFFSEGSWHPCDKNNTLDRMIRNGYKILFRHFSSTQLGSFIKEQKERNEYINEYLSKIMSKEGNIYYELRRDLYMLILDGDFYILGK